MKKPIWRKHYANFLGKDGSKVYLVRCPACDLENYGPAVASGTCAWCGWQAKKRNSLELEG